MKVSIRKADITDIPWILGQLKEFSEFFDSKKKLFGDETHAHNFIFRLIEGDCSFIADDQNEPHGFILGALAPHPFNPEIRLLTEYFWWISKEKRGSRAAVLLLDAFVECGREKADWMTMSLESKSSVSDRHLSKRGFKLQEKSFLLEF